MLRVPLRTRSTTTEGQGPRIPELRFETDFDTKLTCTADPTHISTKITPFGHDHAGGVFENIRDKRRCWGRKSIVGGVLAMSVRKAPFSGTFQQRGALRRQTTPNSFSQKKVAEKCVETKPSPMSVERGDQRISVNEVSDPFCCPRM